MQCKEFILINTAYSYSLFYLKKSFSNCTYLSSTYNFVEFYAFIVIYIKLYI